MPCCSTHQPQVFADVGDFPPPGQGGRRATTGSGLLPGRTRAHSMDADRHRRIHLDKCFSCFDVLERGRVPSGVVWGGLALLTGAPELGKVKFILSIYDADRCDQYFPLVVYLCGFGCGRWKYEYMCWGDALSFVLISALLSRTDDMSFCGNYHGERYHA